MVLLVIHERGGMRDLVLFLEGSHGVHTEFSVTKCLAIKGMLFDKYFDVVRVVFATVFNSDLGTFARTLMFLIRAVF